MRRNSIAPTWRSPPFLSSKRPTAIHRRARHGSLSASGERQQQCAARERRAEDRCWRRRRCCLKRRASGGDDDGAALVDIIITSRSTSLRRRREAREAPLPGRRRRSLQVRQESGGEREVYAREREGDAPARIGAKGLVEVFSFFFPQRTRAAGSVVFSLSLFFLSLTPPPRKPPPPPKTQAPSSPSPRRSARAPPSGCPSLGVGPRPTTTGEGGQGAPEGSAKEVQTPLPSRGRLRRPSLPRSWLLRLSSSRLSRSSSIRPPRRPQ